MLIFIFLLDSYEYKNIHRCILNYCQWGTHDGHWDKTQVGDQSLVEILSLGFNKYTYGLIQ